MYKLNGNIGKKIWKRLSPQQKHAIKKIVKMHINWLKFLFKTEKIVLVR